jgi:hypothetical protein
LVVVVEVVLIHIQPKMVLVVLVVEELLEILKVQEQVELMPQVVVEVDTHPDLDMLVVPVL